MAEYSYPWDGTTTGDAVFAPYNDDTFGDIYRELSLYDNVTDGVIYTAISGYTGNLAVTNPSGTTVRVASGLAMIDGKLYRNTANIDNLCSLSGFYYRIVLRKDFSAQEVTVEVLGPSSTIPAITQTDNDIWELPLATIYNSSSFIVVTDERVYAPKYFSEQFETGSVTSAKLADASTIILLEDTTLGGAAQVDWTGINQNFRSLMLMYTARSVYAPGTEVYDIMRMRFNNDSAANYNGRNRDVSPGPVVALVASGTTYISAALLVNDSMAAGKFSVGTIIIPNYTNTNFDKGIIGTGSGYKFLVAAYATSFDHIGIWNDASAINRITLSTVNGAGNNFDTSSRFTLYGIP